MSLRLSVPFALLVAVLLLPPVASSRANPASGGGGVFDVEEPGDPNRLRGWRGSMTPASVRGDLNGDGAIGAVDALGVLSVVVGKTLPEGWVGMPNGDANCDAALSALDALIVLSLVVGRDVSQFCVGDPLIGSDEACVLTPGGRVARDFTLPLPLFSTESAWNQSVSGAAVLASSEEQILTSYRMVRGDVSSIPAVSETELDWPFMAINCGDWSFSIGRSGAGRSDVLVCNYDHEPDWTNPKVGGHLQAGSIIEVPSPVGAIRPAGPGGDFSDGHLILYDPATFIEYDYWQATTQRQAACQSLGGGLPGTELFEAGAIDYFDVRGGGVNPDGYSSARAHGTPLLAGLILPEDIASGSIDHALAFSLPGPRNTAADPYEPLTGDVFYPASTTEGDYYSTNPGALAAGQRIRLKSELVDEEGEPLDTATLAPVTRMFVRALQDYGAYLVDAAGGFTLYAEDVHSAVLGVSEDEVNRLIGAPMGTPLPAGWTPWKTAMEKLNDEMARIPMAVGPWIEGQDPATAQMTRANFEVVEAASRPGGS